MTKSKTPKREIVKNPLGPMTPTTPGPGKPIPGNADWIRKKRGGK